jgi:hypothetical protein
MENLPSNTHFIQSNCQHTPLSKQLTLLTMKLRQRGMRLRGYVIKSRLGLVVWQNLMK